MDCLFSHIIYGKKTHEQTSSITCEHTHTHTHTNSPYHQLSPHISFSTRDHHIPDPSSKPDMTFPASPLTFLLPHTVRQGAWCPSMPPSSLSRANKTLRYEFVCFFICLYSCNTQ
ncbi:hypothetical protein CHARACLAT_003546 [Characodon lateralis]|uniref:Uncharacterized protein n=1 Tax=Characodon lateralis TaxID=208331 RepID=A0ABU7EG30_9TELE|nr:hypothetical protein [Characodon lateralis]